MGATYPVDFLAKTLAGNGFQVQKRLTIPASSTVYVALDLGLTVDKCIFGLPISLGITYGHAHLDTYNADSFTEVSEIEVLPLNPNIGSTNEAKMYIATNPVGQTNVREYAIGTESTRQSSGGGFSTNGSIKMLINKPLVFEFTNQESSEVSISFGYIWYECGNGSSAISVGVTS